MKAVLSQNFNPCPKPKLNRKLKRFSTTALKHIIQKNYSKILEKEIPHALF